MRGGEFRQHWYELRYPTTRSVWAAAIGLVVGLAALAYWTAARPTWRLDVDPVIYGARDLWAGRDPYAASYDLIAPWWPFPLVYPVPALLALLPIAWLPIHLARAVFAAVSIGLLTYALWPRGPWVVLLLLSGPMLQSLAYAQWSPLLCAAALLPAWGWLLAAKPTIGATLWTVSTDRCRVAKLVLAIVAAGIMIRPGLLGSWLDAAKSVTHEPLVTYPFGWLLLLAGLRWRDPDARLLALLAIIPQSGSFYDGLPLLVFAPSRDALVLTFSSGLGYAIWASHSWYGVPYPDMVRDSWPLVLLTLYLPALVLILGRPRPQLMKMATRCE